jgi:hypothetical protein
MARERPVPGLSGNFRFCLPDFNSPFRPNSLPQKVLPRFWANGASRSVGRGRFSFSRPRNPANAVCSMDSMAHFSPPISSPKNLLLRSLGPPIPLTPAASRYSAAWRQAPPCQMILRQQQPVVAGVFNNTASRFSPAAAASWSTTSLTIPLGSTSAAISCRGCRRQTEPQPYFIGAEAVAGSRVLLHSRPCRRSRPSFLFPHRSQGRKRSQVAENGQVLDESV